ncbi:hypothetical protein HNQ03_003198 [Chryseobacterium sp. 16F]|uniref:Uncharacterized protein n=1 Tax=Frigoriflavimonas asaccharolytica TaxID=2735899 RepID=A0A8J8K9R6_9FLAO|nr:hypothetical protein [Frigoriflavimonas asaccharolytica]
MSKKETPKPAIVKTIVSGVKIGLGRASLPTTNLKPPKKG